MKSVGPGGAFLRVACVLCAICAVCLVLRCELEADTSIKTFGVDLHFRYNGASLDTTHNGRVLAYPEYYDTTANAQDTCAFLIAEGDTFFRHEPIEQDSYQYWFYNDTVSIQLQLNMGQVGPKAPDGYIATFTAFHDSILPPGAFNPDSVYDGLRRVIADTLDADSAAYIGTYKLPANNGTNGMAMVTNGSGTVAWDWAPVAASGTAGMPTAACSLDVYCVAADSGDYVAASWWPANGRPGMPLCNDTNVEAPIWGVCVVNDTVRVYAGCKDLSGIKSGGDTTFVWILLKR